MKRPSRPRPLSQRTLPSGLRTVDLWRDIPLPAPFIPDLVIPPLPIVKQPLATAHSLRPRKKRPASTK